VELTDVELAVGAELATPVEKGHSESKKAMTDPSTGEARNGWEAQWRERKTGCHALERRCRPVERRCDGERGPAESAIAEAARRCCGEVFLFFLERLDEQIRCGCWATSRPTISAIRANGRRVPTDVLTQY
jgi:hypothetical protein